MYKILITILIMFNFSFSGEIGYVWFAGTSTDGDDSITGDNKFEYILSNNSSKQNPTVNTEIYIKKQNILFKNKENVEYILENFLKLRDNKICEDVMFRYYFYTFSEFYNNSHDNKECSIEKLNKERNNSLFYRLPSNIKAKILDIDVYSTIVIFKIEILSEVKDEDVKNNEIEIKERFLCENEANTLFSCETENNKIVSICENDNKTISYKYGFPDKIELEYSSKEGEDINKYFKYNSRIHRGGLYELEFNIGKYTYTVFKYLADFQTSHAGLSVEKNGKTLSIINCIYPEENNYNNLYKLETDYNINGTDNIKDITGELVG